MSACLATIGIGTINVSILPITIIIIIITSVGIMSNSHKMEGASAK